MSKRFSSNTLSDEETDKLFCVMGRKYGVKKLLLKSVSLIESSLDERAFRAEPGYWQRNKEKILAKFPELDGRDLAEVSSSFGLMQLLFTTAWGLGFRGTGEDLYNPVINVELGAKLLDQLRTKARGFGVLAKFPSLIEWEVILCLYNGGATGNPDDKGKLRNQKYADKVMRTFYDLKKKEMDCLEE
jgi:hypothetical protein